MINLELRRKALEASGWTFKKRQLLGDPAFSAFSPEGDEQGLSYSPDAVIKGCPAVEHDPGESEPWFLEWCEKNGMDWEVKSAKHRRGVAVLLFAADGHAVMHPADAAEASTARALAVVAASERIKNDVQ